MPGSDVPALLEDCVDGFLLEPSDAHDAPASSSNCDPRLQLVPFSTSIEIPSRKDHLMRSAFVLAFHLAFISSFSALAAPDDQKKVDAIFAPYDKPNSPGCALGVIQNGNFLYRRGYGTASLELGVPLSSQSVFYMGSVSKQFTAASIVLAAEQGFLSLDDNVRKYIPELPDYGHSITLRQMLHHTSGLRDFLTLLDLSGRHGADIHSREEMLDLIVHQKALNNVPGDEWIYSNTNYFLLGEVLQRATKKSLAEFAAENIFQPLGMVHTRFYDDRTRVVPGRIPAYAPGTDGNFLVDWSTNFDTVGAGGLMSSVDDLLLWDRNFHENKLGKGTLLKELQTPGVLNNGKLIRYALGLDVSTYRGLPIVEHDGALFGYRTAILRFPQQRFTVVCLCNVSSADGASLGRKVADVYLEKDLQAEETAFQPPGAGGFPDPSPFAGKYLDPRTHAVASFTVSGNTLIGWGARLNRIGPNRFRFIGGGAITFDSTDGTMKASLDLDGQALFAGAKIHELHLNEAALGAFVGVFKSTELDAKYTFSITNGSLMLRSNWDPPSKLSPIAPDEFDSEDLGTLVFRRDANHRISGFSVFAGRVRDVSFEKTN
jgi:CubicO group peptidase (beta-lactamase class C family)